MERSLAFSQHCSHGPLLASPSFDSRLKVHNAFSSSLKMKSEVHLMGVPVQVASGRINGANRADKIAITSEPAEINWDDLGFDPPVPTDFMYIAKCSKNGSFPKGKLQPFGSIEISPTAGIFNVGQGIFEGLKAYRKEDGSILLFRPEENALRMNAGAERMCMPSFSTHYFLDAVKETVLANRRWVPPADKGSLYIRPLLFGSGPQLGVGPAPEYTFIIIVTPVGSYFKSCLGPITLIINSNYHRATPGGSGATKTIANYSPTLKPLSIAKDQGYADVLYLDCVSKKYIEELSSCNIFIVKDKVISTPATKGTILPGITRKSIIEVARSLGYQVEERLISVEELLDADEVFCTGTAVVISPVGGITYLGKRVEYRHNGADIISQKLYSAFTNMQMGLTDDNFGWTMKIS